MPSQISSLHRLVWTALLAAGIAVGAFIQIPIGPVPMTLQTLFVTLAGFVLGPLHGALCAGLYVLAGIIGLPVFSGGKSGLGVLFGPTGGFLLGFVLSAALAGLSRVGSQSPGLVRLILFGLLSTLVVFALGIPWLRFVLNIGWIKALAIGFTPFIFGGAVKLALAIACGRFIVQYRLGPLDRR